jgi:hypothetical protein
LVNLETFEIGDRKLSRLSENNKLDFTISREWNNDDVSYVDIDLSVARTKPEPIDLAGRFIYVSTLAYTDRFTIDTASQVGDALLSVNAASGVPIELTKGIAYDMNGAFNQLYIRNAAQTGAKMRIFVSTETEIAPFASELDVLGGVNGTLTDGADVSITTGATTLVLPVDANRKSATISNLLANNTVVRAGSSSAGAARGVEIPVGGSLVWENTAALYIYNPDASTINIGWVEEG